MCIEVSISAYIIDEDGDRINWAESEGEGPHGWSVLVDDGEDSLCDRDFDEFEEALVYAQQLSLAYDVELDFRY